MPQTKHWTARRT